MLVGRVSPNGHRIRVMQSQSTPDREVQRRRANLVWIHTTESTRCLAKKVAAGKASIQKVTVSYVGGRWQAVVRYLIRCLVRPVLRPVARPDAPGPSGPTTSIGVDAGLDCTAPSPRPGRSSSTESRTPWPTCHSPNYVASSPTRSPTVAPCRAELHSHATVVV